MGYEIKLIIGKAYNESDELERDMTKPHADGSGFEYKKRKDGSLVKTGRKEHYFSVMAEIDLCKLGYQEDALNKLIAATKDKATQNKDERFYYFYGTDGNTQIVEDCYGAGFWPVPVKTVLHALKRSHGRSKYRRTDWAIALLSAMVDDSENLEVLFYGH